MDGRPAFGSENMDAAREELASVTLALQRVHGRESTLVEELAAVGAELDARERQPHGVLRVDPPRTATEALMWEPNPSFTAS